MGRHLNSISRPGKGRPDGRHDNVPWIFSVYAIKLKNLFLFGKAVEREYELFVCVVRSGSLSAAARTLGLSPAMVSKRIARLEQRLGARLISRTTRQLTMTDVGEQFFERVVHILAAANEAEAMVSGRAQQPSGKLRVSAPTSFGRLHVTPYVPAFLKRFPAVSMELELDDAYIDLVERRIDLAIRIASEVGSGLTGQRLAANHRVLCASPDYLARHGAPTTLEELSKHSLLGAGSQFPWRLQDRNAPVLVHGRSVVPTNSSEVVRELAVAGLGIALRSKWDVERELASGALRVILPQFPGASDVAIFAVSPAASLVPPSVTAFINHLAEAYRVVPSLA
nr:LysR family transcriptional regulator [Steroidobacter sp.]